MASLTVNATVIFFNRIMILAGILPEFKVSKLLLDSAHDAMPYYEYCRRENITPFIDLNGKGEVPKNLAIDKN